MSFANPNQGVSWNNQEVTIAGVALTTIKDWSGGGWSIDATPQYGAGKDPIAISEGNTTYEPITFNIQETEFINLMEAFGGPEAARGGGTAFEVVRVLSNNQDTQKTTYTGCRWISASPSLAQGPDFAMVACTIQPLSARLNDSFKNELVGTILGKAADFGGSLVNGILNAI